MMTAICLLARLLHVAAVGASLTPSVEYPLQVFSEHVCPLKEQAVPMLMDALSEGGQQAALAVAALKTYGACVDDQDREDLFAALINSRAMANETTVMR